MCDQTPLHYKHGDIVWVKLGVCWWPGEVVDFDKLPEDIQEGFKKPSRKPPLVTVTFFQEDSYEFVKNLNQIYSYNCNKKDDFIKKGMDLHRAKNYSFMEKFPSDICTAERKTNGNEQILDDPKYGPDKKIDFVSLIFGTPSPKKAKEAKGKRSSLKSSPAQKKTPAKMEPNITHPRFTGNDDHQVRMLMQHSNKSEEKKENTYTCQSCDFTSNIIDVIVMHNKYHIQGVYTPIRQTKKTPKRSPAKKSSKKLLKIPSSKTSCIDEDIARLEQGLALSDDDDDDDEEDEESEEELPKPKRKQKPKSPRKSVKKPKVEEEKVEKIADIRVNLLAEWDDEEEEEEEESKKEVQSTSVIPETEKDVDKSCFDFKEDDEQVDEKLPKVVPEKRKSAEPTEDANLPTAEDDINRTIISSPAESAPVEPDVTMEAENNSKEPDLEAFNAILESTSVAPPPEIPQLLKCEQNFHKTKTIKFPDKGLASNIQKPEVATKLTNPKKRFVKSFEDFEQSLKREKIDDELKNKTGELIEKKKNENKSLPHTEVNNTKGAEVNINAIEDNSSIEITKEENTFKSSLENQLDTSENSDNIKVTSKNDDVSGDVEKDTNIVNEEFQKENTTMEDLGKHQESDQGLKNWNKKSENIEDKKKVDNVPNIELEEDKANKSKIEEEEKCVEVIEICKVEEDNVVKKSDKVNKQEEKSKLSNKSEKKSKKLEDKIVIERRDSEENLFQEDDIKLSKVNKKTKKVVEDEDKTKDSKSFLRDKRTRGKKSSAEHENEDKDGNKDDKEVLEHSKPDLNKDNKNKLDLLEKNEPKKEESKDSKSDKKLTDNTGSKKDHKMKEKRSNKEETDHSKNDMKKQKDLKSHKEKKDYSEDNVDKEPRRDRRSSRHSDIKKSDDLVQRKEIKPIKNRKSINEEPDSDSQHSMGKQNKTIEVCEDEFIKEELPKEDHKKQKKTNKDVSEEDSHKRRLSLRKNSKEEDIEDSNINTVSDLIKVKHKTIVEDKKKGKDSKKSKIEEKEVSEIFQKDLLDKHDTLEESQPIALRFTRGKSQESSTSKDVKKLKDSKIRKDELEIDEKFHSRRPKKSSDSFEKRMKLRQERENEERIREEELKQAEEERIEAEKLKILAVEAQKEEKKLIQTENDEEKWTGKYKNNETTEEKSKSEFLNINKEDNSSEDKVIEQSRVEDSDIKSDLTVSVKSSVPKGRRGSRRKTRDSKELDENIKIGYSKEPIEDVIMDEKVEPSTSKDTTKNVPSELEDKPENVAKPENNSFLQKFRDDIQKHMNIHKEKSFKEETLSFQEDISEESPIVEIHKLNNEPTPTEIIPTVDEAIAENKLSIKKLPLEVAKLKSQLMTKLNERGTRKRTQSIDLHLQSKYRNIPDNPSRKTRVKTESIRRLSLQSQEISIEKSIDKIEVTINKEEEIVENISPKDTIAEEIISGKTPELKDLEIFNPSVEKEEKLNTVENSSVSNDVKPNTALETNAKKIDENSTDEVADKMETSISELESYDKVNLHKDKDKNNGESENVGSIISDDNIENTIVERNDLIEFSEERDSIISTNKVDDISKHFVTELIDNDKLNIDKIEIFEDTSTKDSLIEETKREITTDNVFTLDKCKETEIALSNESKILSNKSESESLEVNKGDIADTSKVDNENIESTKEINEVQKVTTVEEIIKCAPIECTDNQAPDLINDNTEEPVQNIAQDKIETPVVKDSSSPENILGISDTVQESTEIVQESQYVATSLEQSIESKLIPESSGLNTLAAISELTFDAIPDEKEISIDKNLTVVSASDLGDGQVEIANIPIMEEGTIKAATIVDYTVADDISSSSNSNEIILEKVNKETNEIEKKMEDVKELSQCLDEDTRETISTVESEMAKLTDNKTDPVAAQPQESTTSSKLLEILTEVKFQKSSTSHKLREKVSTPQFKLSNPKMTSNLKPITPVKSKTKLVVRSSLPSSSKSNKPIIISERIIKPAQTSQDSSMVSVQKVSSKRSFDDIEDAFDTYIIKKPTKKALVEPPSEVLTQKKIIPIKNKTKIINQTIITSSGKVIQPSISKSGGESVFDIDSMPIVLSDQILTPESIENMPIMIQEPPKQVMKNVPQKILNKSVSPVIMKDTTFRSAQPTKTYPKMVKTTTQKVYQSATSTLLKHSPTIISQAGKPGKYMIVPSEASTPTGSKYTVGKRIIKKSPAIITGNKVQHTPEPTGNKIMIVTNNQGQQSRVILTPAQQKKMGYQTTVKKANFKTVVQKDTSKSPNIISQTIINSKGQITTTTNPGVFTSSTSSLSQIKRPRIETKNKIISQKLLQSGSIKNTTGQPRTIIIKNPQGQTVKRIQGTDDALLEQQVAEQIEAINRATTNKLSYKNLAVKRQTYSKKVIPENKPKMVLNSIQNKASSIPPLAPISPNKKAEASTAKISKPSPSPIVQTPVIEKSVEKSPEKTETKRTPHQLVIQDALGNQTTITEGQILALPSETVDGQPQSYMLVTLDETGNLTPLNNEALMSLDPNLGGDLSNMVLQIDQGTAEEGVKLEDTKEEVVEETKIEEKIDKVEEVPQADAMQTVACAINNGDSSQQLIITGDPISTQKFLESLTEGNADFANLLANAEGNILIQADGQQILINNDSESQMLFSDSLEGSEGSGNPVFSSPAPKNQDILAAALADTDVFQQEQPKLSPGGPLYPMNVNNVLETSSMNSPIMTPLEVPSTNSKKIEEEAVILTSAPKNVDLPITITDPNISQSVAHQQVTLDLPLPIQDVAVTSAEMNSPNFAYSLSTLDEKPFTTSISMPLLTEEPEETPIEKPSEPEELKSEMKEEYLLSSGPLCGTMNSQMCSSLSEPPPDMFDFTMEQSFEMKQDGAGSEFNSNSTDDSCEIPVQPEIVTKTVNSPKRCFEEDLENEKKKCKFD